MVSTAMCPSNITTYESMRGIRPAFDARMRKVFPVKKETNRTKDVMRKKRKAFRVTFQLATFFRVPNILLRACSKWLNTLKEK